MGRLVLSHYLLIHPPAELCHKLKELFPSTLASERKTVLAVQIISHKEQKSNSKLSTSSVSSSFNFIYLLLSRRSTLLMRIGMCLQRLVAASGGVLHFPRISISQPTLPRTELLRNNVVPKEFCNILIPCTFRNSIASSWQTSPSSTH